MSKWNAVMAEAIDLAQHPRAPRGENPRVGCVIVDAGGDVVGRGWHRGAGTDHAEVVALGDAGIRARGGTAVVSLEPCRHTGRTPPCTGALIDAGVIRVVFAQSDPTSTAGGGADVLREAGVDVVSGVLEQQAREVNREWTVAVQRGYPFVTAKCAVSLDGRVAGAEGRRVQLTGSDANVYAHALRARVGAIVVGSGTVLADDPQLTVRHVPLLPAGAPVRVVVGNREIPPDRKILDTSARTRIMPGHEPRNTLNRLFDDGVRDVLLESGPTVLAAFLRESLVDELVWLVAGTWVGSGPRALPGVNRLDTKVQIVETQALGEDVLVRATLPRKAA